MIGQKLHDLLDVLTVSHVKLLDYRCLSSIDKRYGILKLIIHKKGIGLQELNQLLDKEVKKVWPKSDAKEHNLKVRRIADFFIEQIEKVLLESHLEKNSSAKNVLLADIVEKRGNVNLLDRYYDKAYKTSKEDEETFYQLMSLKGKIRVNYTSQLDKDLEKALQLNEEFLKVLEYTTNRKKAEYYNNISNIYLEKNSIVKDRKKEINDEILEILNGEVYPINKVWLYFSLAKLNYDDDKLRNDYFQKAKDLLSNIEEKNSDYHALELRIRFLELRLSFFTGKDLQTLLHLSEEIIRSRDGYSIINNNTLFYNILFLIIGSEIDKATKLLEEDHIYFKGSGNIMENFLKAVLYENKGDFKRAIQLLNPIMYTSHYFFAVFARLLLIKIHLKRDNRALCKSLIESTNKFLIQNSGNPLGKEANEYVLKVLKKRIGTSRDKKMLENEKVTLSVFHEYLINDQQSD